jgi:hypothetical protein
MTNWGSEHWELVKIDKNWKIVSVTFSMELTEVQPQPPLATRIAAKKKKLQAL